MTEGVVIPVDVAQFILFNGQREACWQVIQTEVCLDETYRIEGPVILSFHQRHTTLPRNQSVLYQFECLEDQIIRQVVFRLQ